MIDLATRAGSGVAPLAHDTTFQVLDVNEPVLASVLTPVCLVVGLAVRWTAACEDANHEGDYLW